MSSSLGKALLPTVFVTHGGGPLPLLGHPGHEALVKWLRDFPSTLHAQPKAVLVVSAHYEEKHPTVTSGGAPQLVYDYFNFSEEGYKIKYPAPGSPALAQRVVSLLRGAGLPAAEDPTRGWDHGVFVPLKLAFPAASLPVVELSLMDSLDPEAHIAMGEALAPLRSEGVLILGSGMTYHNMSVLMGRGDGGVEASEAFDAALQAVLTDPSATPKERRAALVDWPSLPHARLAHPREEHLLPLHVVFGAATCGAARAVYDDMLLGVKVSSFQFD